MFKLGITGSIGTGKTTLANMFALFKIPIFDADKEIKKILNCKTVIKKLTKIWPSTIEKNNINKAKLKSIVFSKKREKSKLEKLLYPYLVKERNSFEKKNQRKKILVYDVPLIYETGSQKNYDLILLTNCSYKMQKNRVLIRENISD